MKVELSNKTKTNLKAVTLTALVVLIVIFLLTMLVKYPSEFIAIVILLIFLGVFVFQIFLGSREWVVEYQEKKEAEERRRARGY